MERKQSVIGGVAILTLASVMVKVIGMFYKIPLTYVLGDEGMGYFNAAYTIYAWLYMLSTAGFPVAVSIVLSEGRGKGSRRLVQGTMRTAFCILLAIGVVTSTGMASFARQISNALGTSGAYETILAISPTLFLICLTSFFRGCFQGYQNMVPTAISQLIEAVGKVVFGILLALYAKGRGYGLATISAYAVLGVTIGTCLATLYLLAIFLVAKRRGRFWEKKDAPPLLEEKPKILRKLLGIALPVTISASVMSLTSLIDLGMIIRRLTNLGYTQEEATALYGNYTTLVVPMFNLPSILITPIASGIIPALSMYVSQGKWEKAREVVMGAFRTVAFIAVPASFGLALFSRPILLLLYPQESAEVAYRLLTTIAPAVYFVCILTLSNAILQAHGYAKVSMVTMVLGGALKVAVGFVLLGNARFGIYGSPIGTMVCYGVAMLCNMGVILMRLGYVPQASYLLLRPTIASLLSILPMSYLYTKTFHGGVSSIFTLIFIGLSACLYALSAYFVGAFKREDIYLLIGRKGRKSKKLLN